MVGWENPRELQDCKTWNHARRIWIMFSTSFPWVIDDGQREIGSKEILNWEDLEGTKILKNENKTFHCCNSYSSLGCKTQNSHDEGKILEGIRGSVLDPRLGKILLDLSPWLGGLDSWQVGVINMTQHQCRLFSCDIPRRKSSPAGDSWRCCRSVRGAKGQSPVAQRWPLGRGSQRPGISCWSMLYLPLCSSPSRALERLQIGQG